MRTALSLLCALGLAAGLPPSLQGQAGRTLRGSVVAAADTEPIADAVIRLLQPGRERLTHSNAAGRFAPGLVIAQHAGGGKAPGGRRSVQLGAGYRF